MLEFVIMEWGNTALRWLHVIAAMAWIGSSFFFMHLDASLRRHPRIPAGKGGVAWDVHGGGFYEIKKYLVAPDRLPAEMTWHKWQSYTTWLSGFFLLGWVYYAQASLFLIDPAVRVLTPVQAVGIGLGALLLGWVFYDLLCKSPLGNDELGLAVVGLLFVVGMSWFFAQVFSGRGALIHTGALMATFMSGNVFRIIIPNQKKVVAALIIGEKPDPKLGKQAKQRSVHNNYLTLGVVFLMLANHYPLVQNNAVIPVVVALVTIAGALIRHFYNVWHSEGHKALWGLWIVAILLVIGALWVSWKASPLQNALLTGPAVQRSAALDDKAHEIVISRCSMCHTATPGWPGLTTAPKAVRLDEPEFINRQRPAIVLHAVASTAMPPGNVSEMTREERVTLAQWAQSHGLIAP